jgi:S-formylglutathione hydrolase FrmB
MIVAHTIDLLPAHVATRARHTRKRSRIRTLFKWLGLGILTLLATIGIAMAVPASRNFIIDQIIYQGDFFFPMHQKSAVVRYVRVHSGGPVVPVVVPVVNGTVLSGQMASQALHGQVRSYRIYLPPGYASPANRNRRYPVLYLIHGSPGNPGSWIRGAHADWAANEAIAAGTVAPLIMVMPDVNGGQWRDTQCINKWNGTDNEMTYLVNDFVPYIDAHYRTMPAAVDRAIGGLSSGGYCAVNVGLHNPGVFNTIFSISGYFHALPGEVFGLNNPFGGKAAVIHANSPDLYVSRVPNVRHMHLFLIDSTADWGYSGYTQSFDKELTRLHIPHTTLMRNPTGLHLWDHSWAFWSSGFRQVLPSISASFGN